MLRATLAIVALAAALSACQCGDRTTSVSGGLSVGPLDLDFGVLGPSQSASKKVHLSNDSRRTFSVSASLDGDLRQAFRSESTPVELIPGAGLDVEVTYTSKDVSGDDAADLVLTSEDGELRVGLRGRTEIPFVDGGPGGGGGGDADAGDLDGGAGDAGPCDAGCVPATCASLGRTCGEASDGLGGILSCGSCSNGAACSPDGACVCPGGQFELSCSDGTDDDCDAAIDCADPDCAGVGTCTAAVCDSASEVRVTQGTVDANGPDLVWSGSEFGVAWLYIPQTGLDYGFARLDASGSLVGAAGPVSSGGTAAHPPRLAYGGGEWALGFSDVRTGGNRIYLKRLSGAGVPLGADVMIAEGFPACVASRGGTSEFGVFWGDNQATAHSASFALVSAGQKVGTDELVTSGQSWVDYGDVVWDGTGWAAVWTDVRNGAWQIYFARMGPDGALLGQEVQVSHGGVQAYLPRLAWSGQEYAVAWTDSRDGNDEIYFARISATGQPVGGEVRVTNAPNGSVGPALVWAGSRYVLAWLDKRSGVAQVWLANLDGQGNKVGGDRLETCGQAAVYRPSLAWTGSSLGLAWGDSRNGNIEVYFKLVGP